MRPTQVLLAAVPLLAASACAGAMENVTAGLSTLNATLAATESAPGSAPARAGRVLVPGYSGRTLSEADAKASGFGYGDMVTGVLNEEETDTYTFEGRKGEAVVLYVQTLARGNTPPPTVAFRIYNTTGQIMIGDNYSDGSKPIEERPNVHRMVLNENGPHSVQVKRTGYVGSGPYRFVVMRLNDAPEEHPENIRIGQIIDTERLDHAHDQDKFYFQGTKGQRVVVHFQPGPNPAFDGSAAITSETGTHIGGTVSSGAVPLEEAKGGVITLPHTGRYTLHVKGGYDTHGPYRVVVRQVP